MKNILQRYISKVILCVAPWIKRNTVELKGVQRKLVSIIMKTNLQSRMETSEPVYLKDINKAGYKI